MSIEELIAILQKEKSFVLAIDGMCGAGKTTLANDLQQKLGGNIFHIDDFFLPLELRSQERLALPGGNIHDERFIETVLKPLSKHQDIAYTAFDCSQMTYQQKKIIPYQQRNIIEGSYALLPQFLTYYTHTVILKVTPELQIERLKQRNPKKLKQFQERWIPLENRYFEYYHLFEKYPVMNPIHNLE
ncbi:MAG: AAA family ATPase [Longibaculum sp.]